MMTRIARGLTIATPLGFFFGPAVAEIVLILIALLFLVHSWLAREWGWLRHPLVKLLGLLWLSLVVGMILADHHERWDRSIIWVRYPLAFAAVAFWTLRDRLAQRGLALSTLILVVALSADALLQFSTGHDIMGRTPWDYVTYVRLTGPFSSPRVGIVLAWVTFPALGFMIEWARESTAHRMARQMALLAVSAMVLGAIYLSGERMALLLVLMGFGLLALMARSHRKLLLALTLIAGGAIAVIAANHPDLLNRQFDQTRLTITHFDESVYGQIMASAVKVWADHPVLGTGMRNFRYHCTEERYGPLTVNGQYRCGMHPHNPYLEFLVEGGAVAFVLFAAFVGWILRASWRQRSAVYGSGVAIGLCIAFIVRAWPLVAASSQFVPWVATSFWLFAGAFVAWLNSTNPARH